MNKADSSHGRSRREFVRSGFRYALLTGMAVVSALLFQRNGGKLSGQTCLNRGICSRCLAFKRCGLPPALSRKQARNGGPS
jgi:hypothetical protein